MMMIYSKTRLFNLITARGKERLQLATTNPLLSILCFVLFFQVLIRGS
jgi:hypothetical protein